MLQITILYGSALRLAKCHHPHHPGWCKIFRVLVKFVTERLVFCRKLNFLSKFCILSGVKSFYCLFSELIVYFTCILMILNIFIVFLLLSPLCRKFGIAKNYALFGVKQFCLKFGWCKENYILHV